MEETRPAECVVNLDHDLQNTQFSRIRQIGEEFGSNWDNGFIQHVIYLMFQQNV